MGEPAKVSFQMMSDLYMDARNGSDKVYIDIHKEYLILAGNCGHLLPRRNGVYNPKTGTTEYFNSHSKLHEFLIEMSMEFKRVFFVPGYVEYNNEINTDYTIDYINNEYIPELQRAFDKDKRPITILQKGRYAFKDIPLTLLGCTLWAPKPAKMPDSTLKNVSGMWNDLFVEKHTAAHGTQHVKACPSDTHRMHLDHLTWLESAIHEEYAKERDVLIITSTAPTLDSACFPEALLDTPLSYTKGTNARDGMLWLPTVPTEHIRAWCFGSSLKSVFASNNVRDPKTNVQWLSNPYGHPEEVRRLAIDREELKFSRNYGFAMTVLPR